MKVLITGSSGTLGSIIARSLEEKNIQVVGVDVKESHENGSPDSFKFYKCSITDKDLLEEIFRKEEPTNVIHLACTFNKVRNKQKEYEIDIGGSKNILELCNRTHSVKQLIYSSSATAYGGNRDNPIWLEEGHPLRPGSYSYGLNKKVIENIYSATPVREDININLIRICTVVGPTFDKPASVVSILLKWSWLPAFYRDNRVQFLHSEDFASLINLMISDKEIKGVYNIAPDSYSVVKEICPDKRYFKIPVFFITGLLSVLWTLKLMNLKPSAINNSIYPIILDPGKIKSKYGYEFKYTSNEAFEDTRMNNMLPPNTRI
jgi:UDP-glucose 4-epimerase